MDGCVSESYDQYHTLVNAFWCIGVVQAKITL